jgi:GTP cyclohydrolase I
MIDKKKVEAAVRLLLEGIGEDVNREGLRETPRRMAKMYEELFSGLAQEPKQHLQKSFTAKDNQMVIETDIVFYSVCEHHLLPFFGKAHVAYIPNGKVVGLSKLARTVEVYARRPQIQEQLTTQIADALMEFLQPQGTMVLLEAEHMCMTMRGVKKPGSRTITMAARGVLEKDLGLQQTFFQMLGRG